MRSNQTITSKAVILAGLFFLCLFTASNAFAYDYQVTEIQPPVGYTASRAMGINNLGEVVGRFYNVDPATGEAVNRKAFVWDKTNGASLLVTLAGEASAWDINDNGFVAGYSYNAEGKQRAALWDLQEGTIDDIGTLRNTSTGVSGESSTAYGINNLDQVVGNADIPNDANSFTPFHGFVDDASGIRDLGTLNTTMPEYEYGFSIAYDVNNNGQVVGIAQDSP
jgi:probable HAF family extracellular repeat protein